MKDVVSLGTGTAEQMTLPNGERSNRRWRRRVWALAAVVWSQGLLVPNAVADEDMEPWYLDALRAEEIWEHVQGEGVTVAVIDTGVDASVPELRGQVQEGTDLTWEAEGATIDGDGHGTKMASLIAGSGAEGGVQGLAPEALILPVRVLPTPNEIGLDFGIEERLADAVDYAVRSGARVINISLTMQELGFAEQEFDEALAAAAREDVLIFAGTGNDGDAENLSTYPANRAGVVGVAAVDPDGSHAAYSSFGPHVAMAAPGTGIPGRCEAGLAQSCMGQGTSNATAIASASAALIWSAHPDWTKNQVLRAMIGTADGGGERDEYVGYGMVQPARVIVDGEGDPGEPDVNPLFEGYEAAIDPPVSPAPEPEPEPEPESGDEQSVAAEDGESAAGGGGSVVWVAAAGAAVAVAVGGGVVAYRRRRGRLGTVYEGRYDGGAGT